MSKDPSPQTDPNAANLTESFQIGAFRLGIETARKDRNNFQLRRIASGVVAAMGKKLISQSNAMQLLCEIMDSFVF